MMGSPYTGVYEQEGPSKSNDVGKCGDCPSETSRDDDSDGEVDKDAAAPTTKRKKSSRYMGVSMDIQEVERNMPPWRAHLFARGKRFSSGYFPTEDEAAREHDRLALKYGRTDRQNFSHEAPKVRMG